MRRFAFVFTAIGFALVLAWGVGTHSRPADAAEVRGRDEILGKPIYSENEAMAYAKRAGCTKYIKRAIPIYYRMAPRRNIAPDVLVAQAIVETACGRYGGDSRPWNMAGIKKGDATGDEPSDFERPATAREGVRMHINHMCAYTGKKPIGEPHDRYRVARKIQKSRGYWVRDIDQLAGTWAGAANYADAIRYHLNRM